MLPHPVLNPPTVYNALCIFFVADRTSTLTPTGKENACDRFAFNFLTLLTVAGWTSTMKVKSVGRRASIEGQLKRVLM